MNNKKLKRNLIITIISISMLAVLSIVIVNRTLGKINYTNFEDEPVIDEKEIVTEVEKVNNLKEVKEEEIEFDTAKAINSIPDISNILLIGEENWQNDERGRTDSMMILTIDKKNSSIKITSLMRDTYVSIPGHSNNRLNAAYTIGGVSLLKDTIKENYGIEIDNTVLVDFKAFSNIIDTLGGIDINLSEAEVEWLTENNVGEGLKTGKNHLSGKQALVYARTRYVETKDGEANDFGRTNRQREILEIIYDEYRDSSITELIDSISEICPYITTDLTQSQIIDYVIASVSMDNEDIETLRLPMDNAYRNISVNGMAVLDLDWEENRNALQDFIYQH